MNDAQPPVSSLRQILDAEQDEVIVAWTKGWPAAPTDAARAVLHRVIAAMDGRPVGATGVGLSAGALRALRRCVLERATGTVAVPELLLFDEAFTDETVAAGTPSGVRALEDEVKRAGRQLSALVHQMPVGVAIVEAPSGRTLLANEKNREIFRMAEPSSREGIESYAAYVGYATDGRVLRPEEWPLSRAVQRGEVTSGEVVRVKRGDGTMAWIRVSAAPVKDDAGNIAAAAVIFDDVTREEQVAEGLRFLAEASRVLASSLDYEETLKTIARLAVPRLGDWCGVEIVNDVGVAEQLAVAHVDPQKVDLAVELRRRYPPDPNAPSGVPEVIRSGNPELIELIPDELLVRATRDAEHLRLARELGLRSAMTVPIRAGGRVIGALAIVSAEGGRTYTQTDLALAEQVAARAGLAIDNARLYRLAQEAVRPVANDDEAA